MTGAVDWGQELRTLEYASSGTESGPVARVRSFCGGAVPLFLEDAPVSIKVMSSVWESAPVRGGRLLVLLALADFANDNGICWPSITTLAQKARLKRRQTQHIVKKLRDTKLIAMDKGTGPHGANTYKVRTWPARAEIVQGAQKLHPVQFPAGGVQHSAKRGALGHTQTVIEPSLGEPSSGDGDTLKRHEDAQETKRASR